MNYYMMGILNGIRVVGIMFSFVSLFILVLATVDLICGMRWGYNWATIPVGVVFVATGILIIWVTTVALRRAGER